MLIGLCLFVYSFRCYSYLLLSEFGKFRLCEDWKGRNVKPVSLQGNQDLFDARNWESSRRDLITALPVPWFDLCRYRQQYLAPKPSVTSQPASGEFLSSWWRSQPSTALSSMLRAGNPACSFNLSVYHDPLIECLKANSFQWDQILESAAVSGGVLLCN